MSSSFTLNATNKKQLFSIYNTINKNVYGFGTNEAKILQADNLLIFHVQHNRIPCLQALEDDYALLKENVDAAIMAVFKQRLRKALKDEMGIEAKAVLRDYAPDTLIAVTTVVL